MFISEKVKLHKMKKKLPGFSYKYVYEIVEQIRKHFAGTFCYVE